MNKTKIDWCDVSWNPITGCMHGCDYCYARRIAERFGTLNKGEILPEDEGLTFVPDTPETFCEVDEPVRNSSGKIEPYPANFLPTLHRYRLGEPARKTRLRNIFVGSMADVFGSWVPVEWITEVFDACKAAPQHNYLFLTKNPQRYVDLDRLALLPREDNFWYGTTVTKPELPYFCSNFHKTFLSIEPLLEPFGKAEDGDLPNADWVIIGAMTGPGAREHQPHRHWVEEIVRACRERNIPVFMKGNLAGVWGEELIQEFPPELRKEASNNE